jgi:undecaprenyl-diphosphatase
MDIVGSVVLGIIQGVAEFLPISSTGHLILAREFFSYGDASGLAYDAVLQLATSLAVLLYFKKEFKELFGDLVGLVKRKPGDYRLLHAIIVGTIPAIALGILFEDQIETLFRSSLFVAAALIGGSILFFLAEIFGNRNEELTPKKGFIIGFFQSLALIPGISRSGATISGGLLSGLSRVQAARFSFLLSFPIICGAGLYKLFDLYSTGALMTLGFSLIIGSVTSFIFGLASIHFLLKYLKNHTLWIFIIYRLVLAAVIITTALV